jgi:hypothetical protein
MYLCTSTHTQDIDKSLVLRALKKHIKGSGIDTELAHIAGIIY